MIIKLKTLVFSEYFIHYVHVMRYETLLAETVCPYQPNHEAPLLLKYVFDEKTE